MSNGKQSPVFAAARRWLQGGQRPMEVAGRVALVTGGADGIGLETVRQLHALGASVAILDRNGDIAQRVADGLGGRALAIAVDVTDRAGMRAAVEKTIAHFGRLDIVVANAGITPPPATIRTCDPADFDRVMAVNVTGVLNTVHPSLEELIRRQGHIVVIASCAAFCPPVGGIAYMVSKAAVEQLGRGLKLELAGHGVSVTVSYFGLVDTQLARATLDNDPLGEDLNKQLPAPLRKRITPAEAGGVVVEAIRARAPHSMAPKAWEAFSRLRGLVNPPLDSLLVADTQLHKMLHDLEARRGS